MAVHILAEIFKAMNPLGSFEDLNLVFYFMLSYSGFAKEDALSFQQAAYAN